ncbi:MAG TPA: YggS family pyridoxal phosphate-dependent enzyme [Elusimicrobiales bacterium]|nr:YggS family pyridoxal phosphate-dependent enzyme [Elusimicrobiales bacterium]
MPNTRQAQLYANLDAVLAKIDAACQRSDRKLGSVELVIVTKYARPEDVALLAAGGRISRIGESRVLDAASKWEQPPLAEFRGKITKHFIGHLQTNKAAKAVKLFDQIDSIDSAHTAAEVDKQARKLGKTLPVLIQLKLTGKETQSGVEPAKAAGLLEELREFQNLLPSGYMGIAPEGAQQQELLSAFAKAKELFDRDFGPLLGERKCHLSLGMSGDFEAAVEAGATLVRIGSAIFNDSAAS